MSLHPADPVYTLERDTLPRASPPKSQLAFLVLGLLVFAVLWALPVALLSWALGSLFGTLGIAELLERTRGLDRTTFSIGFWLAAAVTLVMVVLEVRAMLRKSEERRLLLVRVVTRPSTALLLLIVPTLLVVKLDVSVFDVPDTITTTMLLCCLGYVSFVLPLGLLAVTWRLTRCLWTIGRGSGFAAGVLGTLGLVFATCMPLTCALDDEDDDGDEPYAEFFDEVDQALERGLRSGDDDGVIEETRALMGSLSTVIDGGQAPSPATEPSSGFPLISSDDDDDRLPAWSRDIDKDEFDPCVRLLYQGGEESPRQVMIVLFVYQYRMDGQDAEEVVEDALFETCARHSKKKYANVKAVFFKKADSRRINRYHKRRRRDRCSSDVHDALYASTDRLVLERLDFETALCSVEERDRKLLRLVVDGHGASEIGKKLGLTAPTVRKRKSRALKTIHKKLGN